MNIIHMLPSEIERLKRADYTDEVVADILESLRHMLSSDRGADDSVYDAARDLSLAGVWEHVPAKQLAISLAMIGSDIRMAFIEGLPEDYQGRVSFEVLKSEAERAFATADADFEEPYESEDWDDKLLEGLGPMTLRREG